MRKIPTLFERSEDRRTVIDKVVPGCEWVTAGEGVATRKWDGVCVDIRRDGLGVIASVRREVKPGKPPPAGFRLSEYDLVTQIRVGWEPADNSGFAKFLWEAVAERSRLDHCLPGTYELCGPKINGNPERLEAHELLRHGEGSATFVGTPRDYDGLREWLTAMELFEGIVWHHPDGRMAKIKRRDFVR